MSSAVELSSRSPSVASDSSTLTSVDFSDESIRFAQKTGSPRYNGGQDNEGKSNAPYADNSTAELGTVVWNETIFSKREGALTRSIYMKNIGFMDKSNIYADSIFLFMRERNISVIYQEIFALLKLGESLDGNLTMPNLPVFSGVDGQVLRDRLIEKGFNNHQMILRRRQRIRDLRLYTQMTHLNVDAYDIRNYKVLAEMVLYPILATFAVILVPLGGFQHAPSRADNSQQINPAGYLVFQIVYCLIAYNPMVRLTSECYVGLIPHHMLWIVMPFGFGALVIAILYYCLLFLDYERKHAKNLMFGLYTYGTWYQFGYLWSIFLYYILTERSNSKNNNNNTNSKNGNNNISSSELGATLKTKLLADSKLVSTSPNPTLGLTKLQLFPRVIILSITISFLYSFCLWFTNFFENSTKNNTFGKNTSLYLLLMFSSISTIAAVVIRGVGNFVDQATDPEAPSMNVIAGFMADSYIIVYYRNLFAYVDTLEYFLFFSLISLVFEVAVYQFSVTETYCDLHNTILAYGIRHLQKSSDNLTCCEWVKTRAAYLYCATHGWRDGELFVSKNALILGYRTVARLSSTIAYVVFAVFLRYGYNASFYKLNKQYYSDKEFTLLMMFIVFSFVFELIAMYFPNKYIFEKTGVSILSRVISFFSKSPSAWTYLAFFIWALGHVDSDVFVAKIDYEHQGKLL